MPPEKIVEASNEKGGIHKKFKLETSIATSNMHAFNFDNQIQKFEGAEEIMNSFYNVRLEYYEKRKAYLGRKFKRLHPKEMLRELSWMNWRPQPHLTFG